MNEETPWPPKNRYTERQIALIKGASPNTSEEDEYANKHFSDILPPEESSDQSFIPEPPENFSEDQLANTTEKPPIKPKETPTEPKDPPHKIYTHAQAIFEAMEKKEE